MKGDILKMNESKPFIHIFKNKNEHYFFDINEHKIVNIPTEVYDLLLIQKETGQSITHPILEKLKGEGYLSSNRVEKIIHPYNDVLEDFLNSKIKKICLQVTQNCNFRCNYCIYSGGYETRDHTNQRMDLGTAKKGIDFLINHSKDSSSIDVSFYGGEPLLEFDFIKACMEYATECGEGKVVTFNMTTNGSLLNENMVEKFLEYNIMISISIDGPKEIHDKNRKFAANGCGTFDTVYSNLKALISKYPEFKKRLQFSMVIDPSIQLNCLNEFVATEEELFNETTIMAGLISDMYKKDELKGSREFARDWEYNKFRYYLYLLGKISDKNNSQLMRRSFVSLLDFIPYSQKTFKHLEKADHHTGPCIPGTIRLFMNTAGDFFPCERVSEKSDLMKIGNVDDGFRIDKIRKLLNVGELTKEDCQSCFAFRGCTVCAAMADDVTKNDLSKELKLSACQKTRHNFEELLRNACTLQEFGLKSEMVKVKRGY